MRGDRKRLVRRTRDASRAAADRVNPRRFAGAVGRNLSLASWLSIVVLAVTLTSLIVAAAVSLNSATTATEDLLEDRVRTLGALKASEVEGYLRTATFQIRVLAASETTAEAARRFTDAYVELQSSDPGRAADDGVARFYRDVFAPRLAETTGATVPWQDLVPIGNAAVHLQYEYTVQEDWQPDDARLLDDAGDGSAWSDVHRDLHPYFLGITAGLEIDDLFIVEPSRGLVVYSVGKAPEFGTALDGGPYSASAPATLMRAVRGAPTEDAVMVADLAPYSPALGNPVAFVGAPILSEGRLLGVLIARLPTGRIDLIMTSGGEWDAEGLGQTGETFLVGADGRMRSISRRFVEDPPAYFDDVARSVTESEATSIRALETTVFFQRAADVDLLEQAAAGDRQVFDTVSYLGRESFSAYRPLDLEGLQWFVAVEVERTEVLQPLADFRKTILLAVSVFVLVLTFSTVAWARRALAPTRAISERLRRRSAGEPESQNVESFTRGPMELRELSDDIERMMEMSDRRTAELVSASGERLDTLRGLLPAAIVERLDAGDRLIVEQVLQASVVVVVLDGLGEIIRSRGMEAARSILDRTVGVLDSLCADHGLERVKVIGEVYYAGCGLNQPYLDHAPRALRYALDARQALRGVGDDDDALPMPAVGIDSGPVSVGLAGSSRLVFDVWGESLSTAYVLAHRARPGEILVSSRILEVLPADIAVRQREDGADEWQVLDEPDGEGGAS
jgi:class 3 adenylate cyclase